MARKNKSFQTFLYRLSYMLSLHKTSLLGGVIFLLSAFCLVSFLSYDPTDANANYANTKLNVKNLLGYYGATLADLGFQLLGVGAPLFACLFLKKGLDNFLKRKTPSSWQFLTGMGGIILFMLGTHIAYVMPIIYKGGLLSALLLDITQLSHLVNLLGRLGILLLASTLMFVGFIGFLWGLDINIANLFKGLFYIVKKSTQKIKTLIYHILNILNIPNIPNTPNIKQPSHKKSLGCEADKADERLETNLSQTSLKKTPHPKHNKIIEKLTRKKTKSKRDLDEAQGTLYPDSKNMMLPPLHLLTSPKKTNQDTLSDDALQANAKLLENRLQEFGVRGNIIKVRPGPVVTLYELEPASGVKASRVIGLSDDIALGMSAVSCRIAPLAGSRSIGIELPNQERQMVYLRELFEDKKFEDSKAELLLALGKDLSGAPLMVDLAHLPHLLVAGTTGAGKSVGLNAMILSLLYRLDPSLCRFIFIDPKMLELIAYNDIPHLLTPVVTDPKKAVSALKWAVKEMEARYHKMFLASVKNIKAYNALMQQAQQQNKNITRKVQTGFDEKGEPIYETQNITPEILPFIVVVIDEMADLMMVAGKEIEANIQRLAQMARAAGVHLITATQRPSVDVITGTIKANFPSRLSFQTASKIDSRTILGTYGAEQLLGRGDMLLMAGGGKLQRAHAPFVSDEELSAIVNFLKQQGKPTYIDTITKDGDDKTHLTDNTAQDDLLSEAIEIVRRDKRPTTSYLQRRLKIGYNRAASLIETMEDMGIISAPNQTGKRDLLGE